MGGRRKEKEQSEDYHHKTKVLQYVLVAELACTVVLTFIIYFSLISPLWDAVYVDRVVADWKKGPIVDIKEIKGSQSCLSEYGEVLGRGYFWGLSSGCTCQGGIYNSLTEPCTDQMLKAGCTSVRARPFTWLEIVHGKKLCAKRAVGTNFLNMRAPAKGKCTDKADQLCSAINTCVPKKDSDGKSITCPSTVVTGVSYDKTKFTLQKHKKGAKGPQTPLLDVQLSEGGAPCVNYRTTHNVQVGKKTNTFLPKGYRRGCPAVSVGSGKSKITIKDGTLKKQFTKVSGFVQISEYTLLKENDKVRNFYTEVKQLAGYDMNVMKKYMFAMYQAKEVQWNTNKCNNDKDKQKLGNKFKKLTVDPQGATAAIGLANRLVSWVQALFGFVQANIYLQLMEFFAIFTHRNGACSKTGYDRFLIFRRAVGLLGLGVVSVLCVWGVQTWDGHRRLSVMAGGQCTDDALLNATLLSMKHYADAAQGTTLLVIFCLLLGLIVILVVGGFGFKVAAVDPDFEDSDAELEERDDKAAQLSQELLDGKTKIN